MMNGRPLSARKKVQLLVLLTILAWATQTLFHQWGYCAPAAAPADERAGSDSSEKFVPADGAPASATLELRAEASVIGQEVRLKQICRWSDADASALAPVAELVLMRFDEKTPFRSISIDEIKGILHDAGVNLAVLRFAGATSCTVGRSDVEFDEGAALQQWIDARQPADKPTAAAELTPAAAETAPATQPSGPAPTQAAAAAAATLPPGRTPPAADGSEAPAKPFHTLRELLVADLATRLNLPADTLQVDFSIQDEKVLNLVEPHFRFDIEARRARNLGNVAWDVTILADGSTQKKSIQATARAWQQQVIVMTPIAFKQIIREEDLVQRRALVDKVVEEPLLSIAQAAGQQASRDLRPGTLMTARMVDAVPQVRVGQFVTVTLQRGGVQLKSVAKALEPGAFGQTIRVKNESTREIFQVTVTGPQAARMGDPPADQGVTDVASVN